MFGCELDLLEKEKECYIAATLLVLCLVTGSNYPVAALRLLVRSFRLLLFCLFAVRRLHPGNSTLLSCLSILFRPHHKHTLQLVTNLLFQDVLMVESPGTAPGSSSVVKLLQRYNTIYNTFMQRCQTLFLLWLLLFYLGLQSCVASCRQYMP